MANRILARLDESIRIPRSLYCSPMTYHDQWVLLTRESIIDHSPDHDVIRNRATKLEEPYRIVFIHCVRQPLESAPYER